MSKSKPLLIQYNSNHSLKFKKGDNLMFQPLGSEYSLRTFLNFYLKFYFE
jgi:hypothetical protein